jgi:hypothetical protein
MSRGTVCKNIVIFKVEDCSIRICETLSTNILTEGIANWQVVMGGIEIILEHDRGTKQRRW